MNGFYGQIIFRINLTHQNFHHRAIAAEVLIRSSAATGLAAWLLTRVEPEAGWTRWLLNKHPDLATGPLGNSIGRGCSLPLRVLHQVAAGSAFLRVYAGGKTPDAIDTAGF